MTLSKFGIKLLLSYYFKSSIIQTNVTCKCPYKQASLIQKDCGENNSLGVWFVLIG